MVRVDATGTVQATSLVDVLYPTNRRSVTPLHSYMDLDNILGFYESVMQFRWNIAWALAAGHCL
jgi:hypothetical protein